MIRSRRVAGNRRQELLCRRDFIAVRDFMSQGLLYRTVIESRRIAGNRRAVGNCGVEKLLG